MLKLSGFEGDTGIDCRIPPGGGGGGRGGGRGPDACSCDASNCRDNGTLSCCCTEGILISFNPYGTGMGCGIPPGGGGGGRGPDACSCDASGGGRCSGNCLEGISIRCPCFGTRDLALKLPGGPPGGKPGGC